MARSTSMFPLLSLAFRRLNVLSFHEVVTAMLCALAAIAAPTAQAVDMQQLIDAAIANGQPSVTIPAGVHEITPSGATPGAHLWFRNASNLVIDGTNATWVFTDPSKAGAIFSDCDNVTLRGLTIDYDPLPYTQGQIVAINQGQKWIEIALDAGYPADASYFTGRLAAYTYDPATRLVKPGSWDMYPKTVTTPRAGVFRLGFTSNGAFAGTAVGDLLVLSRRVAGGVRINDSDGFRLEDVILYAAPGIAVQEAGGEGNGYYHFSVTRGPLPAGAMVPRLHSTNADGFHSASVRYGPTIEGCILEHMGDDAITIHNAYSLVCTPGTSDRVIVSPQYSLWINEGDPVTFLNGDTFMVEGPATVTAISQTSLPEAYRPQIEAMWAKYNSNADDHSYYELTLDPGSNLTLATGDLVSSPNHTGANFTIRNNTIRNHRARGMLIKSGPGLIEHNTIDGSSFAGIALGPEIPLWLGGDFAQGVTVRNNHIRNTGYHASSAYASTNLVGAGIVVHAGTHDRTLSPSLENRDLIIEDNTIENTASVALLVSSARDTVIRRNRIAAPVTMTNPTMGAAFGVDPTAAVFIDQTQAVRFEDNTIDLEGGNATSAVTLGPDAGVENLPAGLRKVTAKIGVNFAADRFNINTNDPLGVPGLIHTQWNNAFFPNGTMTIVDSHGNYGGSMNWIGQGTWDTGTDLFSPDGRMMRSYLYRDGVYGATVTVSGLPALFAGGYELIVYYDSTNASVNLGNRIATVDYRIDDVIDASLPYVNDAAQFAYEYVATPATNANYLVIRSNASTGTNQFRLRLKRADNEADTERGTISGLQIIGLE